MNNIERIEVHHNSFMYMVRIAYDLLPSFERNPIAEELEVQNAAFVHDTLFALDASVPTESVDEEDLAYPHAGELGPDYAEPVSLPLFRTPEWTDSDIGREEYVGQLAAMKFASKYEGKIRIRDVSVMALGSVSNLMTLIN